MKRQIKTVMNFIVAEFIVMYKFKPDEKFMHCENAMMEILSNEQIYEKLILQTIPKARKYIWIATADIKDMYVKNGKRMIPFLNILGDFIKEGILVRIIHAKEPGVNFRTDFDKNPVLIKNLERMLCPRNHLKLVIIDGKYAFMVYNVCAKMTIFHKLGHINAGVEIVPIKRFADQMSTGVSYFEQFVWDLQHRGVSNIDIPVLIIGIDD